MLFNKGLNALSLLQKKRYSINEDEQIVTINRELISVDLANILLLSFPHT